MKFLYKAAKTRGVLPKRFYVQGVRKEGEHPFGGGSFGDVYKGRIDERKVAVKVCRFFWKADTKEQKYGVTDNSILSTPELRLTHSNFIQEIYKEAFIWKPLDHPNVLPFLGICTDGFPSVGLVSPFMDNGNLMNYMKRKPNIDRLDFVSTYASLHLLFLTIVSEEGRTNLLGPRLFALQGARGCPWRSQMCEHFLSGPVGGKTNLSVGEYPRRR